MILRSYFWFYSPKIAPDSAHGDHMHAWDQTWVSTCKANVLPIPELIFM